MPMFVYRGVSGAEREEYWPTLAAAPETVEGEDGETLRRVISAPGRVSIVTEQTMRARELAAKGVVPFERGMDRDAREAQIRREKQDEQRRHAVIRETLAAV